MVAPQTIRTGSATAATSIWGVMPAHDLSRYAKALGCEYLKLFVDGLDAD
jgi:hypothetical protein